MATIVTRAGKGSPLTHDEVDDNFTNLNTDKVETSAIGTAAAANTGDFATAAQGTLADSALQDITGESIEDLSDVASMTPSDGQALVYGSGVWSAADMAGGIAYTRHTANVTMEANQGVIADTSGGTFTVTLPASPATGDTVVITDGGDWATTNLTVGRNGSTIEGDAADMTMDIGGVAVQFTYDGTTWQVYTQLGAAGGNVVSEGDSPTFGDGTFTGDVGIGTTSPSSTLHVNSGGTNNVATFESTDGTCQIKFVDGNQTTDVLLGAKGNDFYVQAGGNEKLRILDSGNVGIGKTNPATALDVDGTVTATSLVVSGNNYPSAGSLSNRNLIINGVMQVAQRGTSTGATGAAYYGPDRFRFTVGSAGVGTYTISQDTNAPDGFEYSYKLDCTTADAAPDASDAVFVATRFEGQDLQQLKKGTASAESVTLSFWVKANLTGTYQVNLFDIDNTRIIGATYAISAADTWEQKTITFAGDTTGAFTNDNNLSLQVEWALDGGTGYTSGAVPTAWETATNADRAAGLTINIADNTANYWQITGVQLEVGDTATPFEHRSYGDELAKCQRYYHKTDTTTSAAYKRNFNHQGGFAAVQVSYDYPVTMRAAPTLQVYGDVSDGTQLLLGAAGNLSAKHGFTVFTAINNGAFVDYHYHTADAEL